MGNNIYYHFFDRELRNSVNANLSDEQIVKIISLSLLMTDNAVYFPISNLYESFSLFPKSVEKIRILEDAGFVYLASSHDSVESFIASRQGLYQHDKSRYPMYFEKEKFFWSSNTYVLKDSTTQILRSKFRDINFSLRELNDDTNFYITKKLKEAVDKNPEKAITFSLFQDVVNPSLQVTSIEQRMIASEIRRNISKFYTQRYLDAGSGTIITGIPEIKYYDDLVQNKFTTNYTIFYQILIKIGVSMNEPQLFELIFNLKTDPLIFSHIYEILSCLMQALHKLFNDLRLGTQQMLSNYFRSSRLYSPVSDNFTFYKNLTLFIQDICLTNPDLAKEIETMRENTETIVIIAVTKTEMNSIITAIRSYFPNNPLVEMTNEELVYRELIGLKKKVCIVQSEMGSVGKGSVINTLHKIIKYFPLAKVIMVGIAFGANEEKQKMGDVLVSRQVWNYEPGKIIDAHSISRGDKVSASSFLLQLFHSVELEYEGTAHFGLFASGEKLFNSKEALVQLKEHEKEIIGGDMEAAGLVSFCSDKNLDWIVIKAICDWGYQKDDTNHTLAASSASNFLMQGLKKIL